MVTQFGKILRKERIEREMTLYQMAEFLMVSPAYLSHMEMGRRPVPTDVLEKLSSYLRYNDIQTQQLKRAAIEAYVPNAVKIDAKGLSTEDGELVRLFARKFPDLSSGKKDELLQILKSVEEGVNE